MLCISNVPKTGFTPADYHQDFIAFELYVGDSVSVGESTQSNTCRMMQGEIGQWNVIHSMANHL